MVTDAIKKMKQEKTGGPPRVMIEMIKEGGSNTGTVISELMNERK